VFRVGDVRLPLAAGLSAHRLADLALGLLLRECADVAWRSLVTLPVNPGGGFVGLLHGDRIKSYFRRRLDDRTFGELAAPAYVPI